MLQKTHRKIGYCYLPVFILFTYAQASIYSGFAVGREFEYIGKFCFTWAHNLSDVIGYVRGSVHTSDSGLQIALYDDEKQFWEYIMTNETCDCACKIQPNHVKYLMDIPPAHTEDEFFRFQIDLHEHLRPRFWYVALVKCAPGGDTFVPSLTEITAEDFRKYFFSAWYEIEMVQANGSQVPVYQEGLATVYAVMMLVSFVALLFQSYAANLSRHSESFHPIFKLLTTIVTMCFVTNCCLFLHFYLFIFNGMGMPLFKCLARILHVFDRVGMILLGMLIAKGWTINNVTLSGQEKLSGLIGVLLVLYLSLSMWYLVWLDPASTLYLYESYPGLGICILHVAVLGWFLLTIRDTREREEKAEKKAFFTQMACIFSFYMASLPIIVAIASVLSPWVRQKIVESVTVSVEFLAYAFLIFVLWPTRAPKHFERLYSVGTRDETSMLKDGKEHEINPNDNL